MVSIILLGVLLKRTSYLVLFPAWPAKTLATAQLESGELLLFVAMVLFAIFAMSTQLLTLYPLRPLAWRLPDKWAGMPL